MAPLLTLIMATAMVLPQSEAPETAALPTPLKGRGPAEHRRIHDPLKTLTPVTYIGWSVWLVAAGIDLMA